MTLFRPALYDRVLSLKTMRPCSPCEQGLMHFTLWVERCYAANVAAMIFTGTDLYAGVPECSSWFSSAMSELPSG